LKRHLLPRILDLHSACTTESHERASVNNVFLNNDRIYRHQIMSIHYTSYDVWRRREIIHTGPGKTTAYCDIMGLLATDDNLDDSDVSRFWFAHVLGIFHVNVIYTGDGSSDLSPRRLDFLWVRYYSSYGRTNPCSLDRLKFPPVAEKESFGFLDPGCVLRCCHIIPAFHIGKRNITAREGISGTARNHEDWKLYYINRCVQSAIVTSALDNIMLTVLPIVICSCSLYGVLP
jgi:hypothetical protein